MVESAPEEPALQKEIAQTMSAETAYVEEPPASEATPAPEVTVIVAAFDAMPYVTRAIGSIFSQTLGIDRIEIIAVNDGSGDGTGDELDRLATQCKNMHVVHQANSGSPAQPRNVGLGRATGRYIFFLDADDYLGDEALERMVAAADANQTDLVLGRLVGVGGRKTPRSMFRVNQTRTAARKSRVFWSLNPMKLFRRSFVEDLGLKFATDLQWGEDMPFVAECFLRASGISIVADYDCVYLTYRDDGNNFTKRVSHVTSRLETPTRLLTLIERHVGPGRDRDHLMSRVFQLEVINILPRLAAETDPEERRVAFDTIKGWVDRWYTKPIAYRLSPLHKLALNLVRRGLMEEVVALFPEWPPAKPWDLLIEGARVYARYPYFRDPTLAIPDSVFEVTRKLEPHCHIDSLEWRGDVVTISGYAYIMLLDTVDARLHLVLRSQASGAEVLVPATQCASDGPSSEEWNRQVFREEAGFAAVLDPAIAADGAPLEPGRWDASLRIACEGVTREVWLGTISCEANGRLPQLSDVSLRQPDADQVAPGDESPLAVSRTRWKGADGATLEIAGRAGASLDSVEVVILGRGGGERRIPVEVVDEHFDCCIDLTALRMAPGAWQVVLESRFADTVRILATPAPARLKARVLRRGVIFTRFSARGSLPTLTIVVERLGPAWLLNKIRTTFRLLRAVFAPRN